jgi:hypothetical protein
MVPILFRAFSTVITVAVAVVVAATLGNSSSGKIWAAIIIAIVIAATEWLLIWTPKHFAVARKLLDPRANMVGVWLQDVRRVLHQGNASGRRGNRFAIFWVDHDSGDYGVTGFAYTPTGTEHSRWTSVAGSLEFAQDGYSMTYRWKGTITDESDDNDPERVGFSYVDLHSLTGRVDHVGMNLSLVFDVQQITPEWLIEIGLNQYRPNDLKNGKIRDEVAIRYANSLPLRSA